MLQAMETGHESGQTQTGDTLRADALGVGQRPSPIETMAAVVEAASVGPERVSKAAKV